MLTLRFAPCCPLSPTRLRAQEDVRHSRAHPGTARCWRRPYHAGCRVGVRMRQGAAWLSHAPGPAVNRGSRCYKLRARCARCARVLLTLCLVADGLPLCAFTRAGWEQSLFFDMYSEYAPRPVRSAVRSSPSPCRPSPWHAASIVRALAPCSQGLGCRERHLVKGIGGKTECRTPAGRGVRGQHRAPAAPAAAAASTLIYSASRSR